MRVNTISEAKAQFSALVERALAGEEVIIARAGKPVVKLVRHVPEGVERRPGTLRGKIEIAEDFDSLPPDIAAAFGATEE
jgi:antitoxin (DNA-binding transcriptional repressor) of toxin-antitoxin stability system